MVKMVSGHQATSSRAKDFQGENGLKLLRITIYTRNIRFTTSDDGFRSVFGPAGLARDCWPLERRKSRLILLKRFKMVSHDWE